MLKKQSSDLEWRPSRGFPGPEGWGFGCPTTRGGSLTAPRLLPSVPFSLFTCLTSILPAALGSACLSTLENSVILSLNPLTAQTPEILPLHPYYTHVTEHLLWVGYCAGNLLFPLILLTALSAVLM